MTKTIARVVHDKAVAPAKHPVPGQSHRHTCGLAPAFLTQPVPPALKPNRRTGRWQGFLACSLTVLLLCLFSVLIPSSVHGQVVTASLQGQVQDSTGAVVPRASVKVTNTSTGITSVLIA
jgi:hypothetical protein